MIRTAEQYVESLRDGRVVYQDGERVEDVPTRYQERVERCASEFWMAQQPEHRALFNVEEDGEEVSFSFKMPRSVSSLLGSESQLPSPTKSNPSMSVETEKKSTESTPLL